MKIRKPEHVASVMSRKGFERYITVYPHGIGENDATSSPLYIAISYGTAKEIAEYVRNGKVKGSLAFYAVENEWYFTVEHSSVQLVIS